MDRKTKDKKPCTLLNESQTEQLARLIIEEAGRHVHHGVNRVRRITAPSGAVMLF